MGEEKDPREFLPDYTVHGMRIRTRRQRKGWRQEDLAREGQ